MYVANGGNTILRADLPNGSNPVTLTIPAGFLNDPYGIALDLRQPSTSTIPTLSEWGMIILSLLMAGAAILIIRRKNCLA
jgi:hypothetical protein